MSMHQLRIKVDPKDSFHGELESVLDQFPKYHVHTLLGHFSVARIVERRNAYKFLVGNSEGKRPLVRPRRRWENNIRMSLRQIVWGSVDWIRVVKDRGQQLAAAKTVINVRVP
jgi:hypothetical protein